MRNFAAQSSKPRSSRREIGHRSIAIGSRRRDVCPLLRKISREMTSCSVHEPFTNRLSIAIVLIIERADFLAKISENQFYKYNYGNVSRKTKIYVQKIKHQVFYENRALADAQSLNMFIIYS